MSKTVDVMDRVYLITAKYFDRLQNEMLSDYNSRLKSCIKQYNP